MVYVFIDTNIYIACSLGEKTDATPNLLKKLIKVLGNGSIKLLVPEVIEKEYEKVFKTSLERLETSLGKVQKTINDNESNICEADKIDIIKNIESIREKRKKYVEDGEVLVRKVFAHKGAARIPVKPDTLVKAYLRQIAGQRPFTKEKYRNDNVPISTDCVAFECIVNYLNDDDSGHSLYICTGDDDYGPQGGLHPDITGSLKCKVERISLPELLKKYGLTLKQDDIDRFYASLQQISSQLKPYVMSDAIVSLNETFNEYKSMVASMKFPILSDELLAAIQALKWPYR